MNDLTGKRFGYLEPLEPSKIDGYDRAVWKCRCHRCGNTVVVRANSITSGNAKSCGCLNRDLSRERRIAQNNADRVDETRISTLKSKVRKDNKSGVRGVCYIQRVKKWSAEITFKKKKYFLGHFEEFEQAVEARKKAEDEFFKPIIEDWESSQ